MTRPASFSIRSAIPQDAQALALVGAATFLEAFCDLIEGEALIAHCRTQHSETAYADFLAGSDPRGRLWLAEDAGTCAPIGYAVTCPPDVSVGGGPDDIELKRIYLLSRCQGSGAAQALMDAALAHAKACAAPSVRLGTYHDNQRAIAFYRRNGFETVGTRRFRVGHREFDDLVMARPLA